MVQDNSISSVVRAMRVINFIVDSEKNVTFNELLEKLRIPQTTLFRVLSSLQRARWIEKKGKTYEVGPGILQMGMRALSKLELRKIAIPWVDKLSQLTGETANLAVLSGKGCLVIEVCDGPKHVKISSRPGTLITCMHCSAGGKVLLAFAVEEDLKEFYKNTSLEKRTKNSITDIDELEKEIKKVIRAGYAVDNMEYFDDVRCLAAPIKNAYGKTIAAIGITATTTSFKRSMVGEVAAKVLEIAASISRELGAHPNV